MKLFESKTSKKFKEHVSIPVRLAHEKYVADPTPRNLRMFTEKLMKAYTNYDDQMAVRKELGFKILDPKK
jgi:uncharacterized protein (UPF0147 family)